MGLDFMRQLADAAPQMGQMSAQLGQGMGQLLALVQELVRQGTPATGYGVRQGTTTDSFPDGLYDFSRNARSIDLTIEGNDALVELSYDGTVFGSSFYLKAGGVYSLPVAARAFRIRSRVAGAQATYQAVILV